MTKKKLVLVHSFPTNSIILSGLKEFLEDYFSVYFIDLPGFNNNSRLDKPTLDGFSNYVSSKIKEKNLKNYWLGGISFGFIVINNCKPDKNCKGFLAIEPFTSSKLLRMSQLKKLFLNAIVKTVLALQISQPVYFSPIFKQILMKSYPVKKFNILLKTVDPFTFFSTANIVFNYHKRVKLQDKPYILIMNNHDEVIKFPKTKLIFSRQRHPLLIKTTMHHVPKSYSKEYFQKHISKESMKTLMALINS